MDADAGVVDQRIEPFALPGLAQGGPHLLGEGAEGRAVGHVQLQRHGLAAEGPEFGDQGVSLGLAAVVGEDQVMAVAGQVLRGVLAQAAAGAGDQDDLAHRETLECMRWMTGPRLLVIHSPINQAILFRLSRFP
ncbi:hypothetical protein D9M69_336940 [compost metagenome]